MEKNNIILKLYEQLFKEAKCKDIDLMFEFIEITLPILQNDDVLNLKNIIHHKHTNRLMHSMHVSYYAYYSCKKRGWDYISATRAGLLHDFFIINKLVSTKKICRLSGFYHPYIATKNANKLFSLNSIEKECIKRHMFPLTPIPAKYKEAWSIIWWDKIWCARELLPSIY